MAHGAGWEGHVAIGPESSFGLGAGAACSLDLPQPEAELQLCKERRSEKHSSAPAACRKALCVAAQPWAAFLPSC